MDEMVSMPAVVRDQAGLMNDTDYQRPPPRGPMPTTVLMSHAATNTAPYSPMNSSNTMKPMGQHHHQPQQQQHQQQQQQQQHQQGFIHSELGYTPPAPKRRGPKPGNRAANSGHFNGNNNNRQQNKQNKQWASNKMKNCSVNTTRLPQQQQQQPPPPANDPYVFHCDSATSSSTTYETPNSLDTSRQARHEQPIDINRQQTLSSSSQFATNNRHYQQQESTQNHHSPTIENEPIYRSNNSKDAHVIAAGGGATRYKQARDDQHLSDRSTNERISTHQYPNNYPEIDTTQHFTRGSSQQQQQPPLEGRHSNPSSTSQMIAHQPHGSATQPAMTGGAASGPGVGPQMQQCQQPPQQQLPQHHMMHHQPPSQQPLHHHNQHHQQHQHINDGSDYYGPNEQYIQEPHVYHQQSQQTTRFVPNQQQPHYQQQQHHQQQQPHLQQVQPQVPHQHQQQHQLPYQSDNGYVPQPPAGYVPSEMSSPVQPLSTRQKVAQAAPYANQQPVPVRPGAVQNSTKSMGRQPHQSYKPMPRNLNQQHQIHPQQRHQGAAVTQQQAAPNASYSPNITNSGPYQPQSQSTTYLGDPMIEQYPPQSPTLLQQQLNRARPVPPQSGPSQPVQGQPQTSSYLPVTRPQQAQQISNGCQQSQQGRYAGEQSALPMEPFAEPTMGPVPRQPVDNQGAYYQQPMNRNLSSQPHQQHHRGPLRQPIQHQQQQPMPPMDSQHHLLGNPTPPLTPNAASNASHLRPAGNMTGPEDWPHHQHQQQLPKSQHGPHSDHQLQQPPPPSAACFSSGPSANHHQHTHHPQQHQHHHNQPPLPSAQQQHHQQTGRPSIVHHHQSQPLMSQSASSSHHNHHNNHHHQHSNGVVPQLGSQSLAPPPPQQSTLDRATQAIIPKNNNNISSNINNNNNIIHYHATTSTSQNASFNHGIAATAGSSGVHPSHHQMISSTPPRAQQLAPDQTTVVNTGAAAVASNPDHHHQQQQASPMPPDQFRLTLPYKDTTLIRPFRLEHEAQFTSKVFHIKPQLFESLSKIPYHHRPTANVIQELQFRAYLVGSTSPTSAKQSHNGDSLLASNNHQILNGKACNWPEMFSISVNQQVVHLDRSKQGHKAVDIFQYCHVGDNVLDIQVNGCYCTHEFVLEVVDRPTLKVFKDSCFKSRLLNTEASIQKLKVNFGGPGFLLQNSSLQAAGIFNEYITDHSQAVELMKIKVSLRCPISGRRMTIPTRGHSCKHLQCFDLDNFLQMNRDRSQWNCPICSLYVPFHLLDLDQHQMNIVKAMSEILDTDEIIIDNSGQWQAYYCAPAQVPPAQHQMTAKSTGTFHPQPPYNPNGSPLPPQQQTAGSSARANGNSSIMAPSPRSSSGAAMNRQTPTQQQKQPLGPGSPATWDNQVYQSSDIGASASPSSGAVRRPMSAMSQGPSPMASGQHRSANGSPLAKRPYAGQYASPQPQVMASSQQVPVVPDNTSTEELSPLAAMERTIIQHEQQMGPPPFDPNSLTSTLPRATGPTASRSPTSSSIASGSPGHQTTAIAANQQQQQQTQMVQASPEVIRPTTAVFSPMSHNSMMSPARQTQIPASPIHPQIPPQSPMQQAQQQQQQQQSVLSNSKPATPSNALVHGGPETPATPSNSVQQQQHCGVGVSANSMMSHSPHVQTNLGGGSSSSSQPVTGVDHQPLSNGSASAGSITSSSTMTPSGQSLGSVGMGGDSRCNTAPLQGNPSLDDLMLPGGSGTSSGLYQKQMDSHTPQGMEKSDILMNKLMMGDSGDSMLHRGGGGELSMALEEAEWKQQLDLGKSEHLANFLNEPLMSKKHHGGGSGAGGHHHHQSYNHHHQAQCEDGANKMLSGGLNPSDDEGANQSHSSSPGNDANIDQLDPFSSYLDTGTADDGAGLPPDDSILDLFER